MANLKQSAPDWCFFKGNIPAEHYYGRLKEIGYAGVEMVEPERWAAAKAAGLEIVNMSGPGMQDGLNRVENHEKLLAEIREAIATAAQNGIGHVIIFSGNRNGQDDEEGKANCVTAIKQLVPDAEKAGVTLVFEMLNMHDHPDYQADRSAFGFDIIKAVGSPSVKVLYDIYHMYRMGDDVVKDITENLDIIAHIHVAGSPKRDFPGADQQIDYPAIIKAIKAAGDQGYWGQEWLPGEDVLDELAKAYEVFDSSAA